MKTKLLSLFAICAATFSSAQTTLLSEGFDNITTLTTWTQTNQSTTVGTTSWFQGNDAVFPSQTGAVTSYIGANFNNTAGNNTISNWLITPSLMLQNGDVIKFWSRTVATPAYADRLQVRLSNGTYAAPVGSTGIGSFSTALLEINASLTTTDYPNVWTEYTIAISGLSATPVAANIGFRYFVTSGGPGGSNSDYIGIDTFSVTRPALAVSDVNKSKMSVYPNPTSDYLKINTSEKISSVEVYDISGKKVNAEFDGISIDVQKLEKGSYVIKINGETGTITQKFIKK